MHAFCLDIDQYFKAIKLCCLITLTRGFFSMLLSDCFIDFFYTHIII